jgi:hypothetical protein
MSRRYFPLLIALVPAAAAAHPGHGTTDSAGLLHYVIEGPHAAPLLLAVAGGAVLAQRWWERRRARRH